MPTKNKVSKNCTNQASKRKAIGETFFSKKESGQRKN